MNWKVGDMAIFVGRTVNVPSGTEVEIIRIGGHSKSDCVIFVPGFPSRHSNKCWGTQFNRLKKLPPPNEVTSWEDCIFRPTELVLDRQNP